MPQPKLAGPRPCLADGSTLSMFKQKPVQQFYSQVNKYKLGLTQGKCAKNGFGRDFI